LEDEMKTERQYAMNKDKSKMEIIYTVWDRFSRHFMVEGQDKVKEIEKRLIKKGYRNLSEKVPYTPAYEFLPSILDGYYGGGAEAAARWNLGWDRPMDLREIR
jgi:hypothetical protein